MLCSRASRASPGDRKPTATSLAAELNLRLHKIRSGTIGIFGRNRYMNAPAGTARRFGRPIASGVCSDRLYPAFTGKRTEFRRGLRDSDIAISILPWIERGGHGAPKG